MIISCGEALVDMVPDAVPGGGPMNVAIAAARLGAPAAFVGRVSTDRYGDQIWDHLASNDVDLRLTERGPEPTARAIVEHTPKLSFRFEGDGTADTALESADLSPVGPGPHIVHGGTLALFRGRTAELQAQLVERHDGLVSLDPNIRPPMIKDRAQWDWFHNRWLTNTHVYRASDEDLEWIWPGRDHQHCADELFGCGVKAMIVTKGAKGAEFFLPSGQVTVDGRSVEVADTVGAGDTFVAATLVGLLTRGIATPGGLDALTHEDWSEIGSLAVAASAITCGRPGANPPFASELDLA